MAKQKNKTKIDWSQELENAVNANRIQVDNFYSKQTQNKLDDVYLNLFDSIIKEVRNLFDKANDRGKWIKSDAIKYGRMEKLIQDIAKELRFKNKEVKALLKKEISGVYKHDYFKLGDILNDFGLLDKTNFFQANLTPFIKDVLAQDVQGLTYLQRADKITQAEAIQLEEQIRLSQSLGEGISQTSNRIRKTASIGKASARRLAATTILSSSNNAHLQAYKQLDFVQYVVWSAALDSRTCPICGVQDGKRFKIENAPPLPIHFNCRCSYIPFVSKAEWKKRGFDSDIDAGTRIARDPNYTGKGWGKNIKVPADTTYIDYFQKLPEKTKIKVMGKGKYELWKKNKIEFEDIAPNMKIVPLKKLNKKANK